LTPKGSLLIQKTWGEVIPRRFYEGGKQWTKGEGWTQPKCSERRTGGMILYQWAKIKKRKTSSIYRVRREPRGGEGVV